MTEQKIFEEKREKWLKEVADQCHEYAISDPKMQDFYVFQSRSDFFKPNLLIIGANPGDEKNYLEALKEKNIERRTAEHLEYSSNQYIENENNPKWRINKPILMMFNTPKLRKILENSVIMNAVYFNTRNVQAINNSIGKEAKKFCIEKTKEFIDIIQPKNVLLLGKDPLNWLKIKMNNHENMGLSYGDDKNALVLRKELNGIQYFQIFHPSRNSKFNSAESLNKKSVYFEEVL